MGMVNEFNKMVRELDELAKKEYIKNIDHWNEQLRKAEQRLDIAKSEGNSKNKRFYKEQIEFCKARIEENEKNLRNTEGGK